MVRRFSPGMGLGIARRNLQKKYAAHPRRKKQPADCVRPTKTARRNRRSAMTEKDSGALRRKR
jgi:hypothetical protein